MVLLWSVPEPNSLFPAHLCTAIKRTRFHGRKLCFRIWGPDATQTRSIENTRTPSWPTKRLQNIIPHLECITFDSIVSAPAFTSIPHFNKPLVCFSLWTQSYYLMVLRALKLRYRNKRTFAWFQTLHLSMYVPLYLCRIKCFWIWIWTWWRHEIETFSA